MPVGCYFLTLICNPLFITMSMVTPNKLYYGKVRKRLLTLSFEHTRQICVVRSQCQINTRIKIDNLGHQSTIKTVGHLALKFSKALIRFIRDRGMGLCHCLFKINKVFTDK